MTGSAFSRRVDSQPSSVGRIHVHEDDVGPLLAGELQRHAAALGGAGAEAPGLEALQHELPLRIGLVDDDDGAAAARR